MVDCIVFKFKKRSNYEPCPCQWRLQNGIDSFVLFKETERNKINKSLFSRSYSIKKNMHTILKKYNQPYNYHTNLSLDYCQLICQCWIKNYHTICSVLITRRSGVPTHTNDFLSSTETKKAIPRKFKLADTS